MGIHPSPGLSRGHSVAPWGHQRPRLEGGYHLSGTYSHSLQDSSSLAPLQGPKRRRGSGSPGVSGLRSAMSVSYCALFIFTTLIKVGEISCIYAVVFLSLLHQYNSLVKSVLQAPLNVGVRAAWKSGRSAMALTTAETWQMSRTAVRYHLNYSRAPQSESTAYKMCRNMSCPFKGPRSLQMSVLFS